MAAEQPKPLEGPELASVLERLAGEGMLFARDRIIDAATLKRIVQAAPRPDDGPPTFMHADFFGAVFTDDVDLGKVVFDGGANFGSVSFRKRADFHQTVFSGDVWFGNARFTGTAWFLETRFEGDAQFPGAIFVEDSWFSDSVFLGDAEFGGPTYATGAAYAATFCNEAVFDGARFEGSAQFGGTIFDGAVTFSKASFGPIQHLGPLIVTGRLSFDGADFERRVEIEASAGEASFIQARFRDGAELRFRWARMVFEQADFSSPSLISLLSAVTDIGGEPFIGPEAPRADEVWQCEIDGRTSQIEAEPKAVSLSYARVGALSFANVDLGICLFDGAHGLDALRFEGNRFLGVPDTAWWTARQALAEEHLWRAEALSRRLDRARATASGRRLRGIWASWHAAILARKLKGWGPPRDDADSWREPTAALDPAAIATRYRALRKGLEDRRDEPGAADFYYGEMEMRRHATGALHQPGRLNSARGERLLLSLYWLVSGYGLRASRALIALAVTVTLFVLVLYLVGLREPNFWDALVQGFEGATLRDGNRELLTTAGQALQVILRLLGPLFLALALISFRGRVKR